MFGRSGGAKREKRVGKCYATFHITPKTLHEERERRRARAVEDSGAVPPESGGEPPPT
jgi:hypothetical protein